MQDDPLWDETENFPGSTRRRLRKNRSRKKLAQILDELAADASRARVSLADLVLAMHGRAFGALLLIFAFPNALPAIPGTSSILGLPLLFLATQMMLGKPVWLPKVIALRSMSRDDFGNLVERVNPWLEWADKFTEPRLLALSDPWALRALGAFCLILSIVLVLPIPLGNMLPGIALCLIALGVLERDGVWIAGGTLVGVIALVIAWGVVYAIARTVWFLVLNAF
ncbi:exopolysaccharide biosynthesis protein [Rubellimicrobium roseum]|uniref:Exopolysaccharide biosynthesis protein n=1 Tax=Rubellimicrobium roseum TaxID=687525 RepID=A0A5C4NPR4_9RHOB|nr:exopolysaccharide biosynthesis protein [Rubellimicrobium roseum]TNC74627.1 exopolysaccharide biosynthesis protein [Rubellimicrobium roseum]